MLFKQIRNAPTGSYTYLLADSKRRVGLVIDPVTDSRDVLLALIGDLALDVRFIMLTHADPDSGRIAKVLRNRTGSVIVASAACKQLEVDLPVDHGDHLGFGDEVIEVIDTPGHSRCSISYRCCDRVFTGKTLLIGSCGDTTQPGADAGTLFDSVTTRLFALPPETLIFPGIDPAGRTVSTIAEERSTNPRFVGQSREAFATLMSGHSVSGITIATFLCASGR